MSHYAHAAAREGCARICGQIQRVRFRASSLSIFPERQAIHHIAFLQPSFARGADAEPEVLQPIDGVGIGIDDALHALFFASGHQRQSRSSRFGAALSSIHVPVSAAASMIAGMSTA